MTVTRLLIAALVILTLPGCRRAADGEQVATVPGRDVTTGPVPAHYRFLSEPGVSLESIDSLWSQIPYDSIYLKREPCFGTCPMYEATLYRGGKARYSGTRFVERIGNYHGEVTIQDFGRLAYLLDRLGYMSLPDSFSAPYTDLPAAVLAVNRRPEGTKTVHDYGYVGPVELWTIMQVFDGVLNRIQWTRTEP